MEQPKFKFDEEIEYSGFKFKVKDISYRINLEARPEGYYYKCPNDSWHHENAIKKWHPTPTPITKIEFHLEWNRLYGCTWDNSKSEKTFTGLITFLKTKNLLVES